MHLINNVVTLCMYLHKYNNNLMLIQFAVRMSSSQDDLSIGDDVSICGSGKLDDASLYHEHSE